MTNSPGSPERFWQAALQGMAPGVCTSCSSVPQHRPDSWGQSAAGVTRHLVHSPPAPCFSPLLSHLPWHAGVHASVSHKTC